MWSLRTLGVLAALSIALPASASGPGAIEVNCDVDRTAFRAASSTATQVTFRLWDAASGGTQCGPDHVVVVGQLIAFKRFTDRTTTAAPPALVKRKPLRLTAALGSDGSPIQLCTGAETWMDVMVGTTTLTCDFSAQVPQPRKRLQAVAFARESSHSETCETCVTAGGGGGAVKAWVSFVGPTATIRGASNVGSVTHSSLGNFVINFTTPMADANYAALLTAAWNGAGNQAVYPMIVSQSPTALTIYINNGTSAYGPYDPSIVSVLIVE